MSELREYLCIEAKTIERKDVHCYRFTSATKSAPEACMEPVYLKSEADKVIAYHKYKRCLAMADKCAETAKKYYYLICLDGSNNPKYDRFPNKMDFWGRWRKRWLELAEKFKPNKEAE